MSASDPTSSVYMTDDASTIKKKINKHAFSGGGGDGSAEDQRKYGGNPEVDVSYVWLGFFEDDDALMEKIEKVSFDVEKFYRRWGFLWLTLFLVLIVSSSRSNCNHGSSLPILSLASSSTFVARM